MCALCTAPPRTAPHRPATTPCCTAGLQQLEYPATLSAEFKRPTLLPAVLHCGWHRPAQGAAAALRGPEGLRVVVLSEDKAKEVLVACLRFGAAPAAAASS